MITRDVAQDIPLYITIERTTSHYRAQRGCWGTKAKTAKKNATESQDLTGLISLKDAADRLKVREVTMRTYIVKYGLTRKYRKIGGSRSRLVLLESEIKKLARDLRKKESKIERARHAK